MTFFVYGLEDPRTDALRYVGYTHDLEYRHRRHMCDSKLRGNCHRQNWLKELKKEDLYPVLVVLAWRDTKEAVEEAERELITRFRQQGYDLTNGTDGGDGGATFEGRRHNPETRQKMSMAQKGHTRNRNPEVREKIASKHRGKKAKPEWVAAAHAATRRRWEKYREESSQQKTPDNVGDDK